MDKHASLNKIGHALHYINPVFRWDVTNLNQR